MEFSRHIQSPDLLRQLPTMLPGALREHVLSQARAWYASHPADASVIEENLRAFGLNAGEELVSKTIDHTGLHYFEKLVGLCGGPQAFHEFLQAHVDAADAAGKVAAARDDGKGVLLATPHFGGVELIVPSLSMQKTVLSAALRFKTEQLSRSAHARAQAMADSGLFAPISFIEVGRPGTRAALDMAAALRRKETLLSVFDEKTEYSIEVRLFDRVVWGGAGLDKLIAFAAAECAVFAAFMVRLADDRYRLELETVEAGAQSVARMYGHLEKHVRQHAEQWYFLHEDIPFVENS